MNRLTKLKISYFKVNFFFRQFRIGFQNDIYNLFPLVFDTLTNAIGATFPRTAIIFAGVLGPQPAKLKQTFPPLHFGCPDVHAEWLGQSASMRRLEANQKVL